MKTILITGGAGSVGREVAAQLAADGHRLRIFDLPACDFSPFQAMPQAVVIAGDIRDGEGIDWAVQGVDAVLHLAALLPPVSERDRQATLAINVGGTANIISAMERHCPAAHLVLSSSVCVYGDTGGADAPIDITYRTHAADVYAESKIASERLVLESRLPHTILRISGISVPAFLEPPQPWPFAADQRIEFVCRTDVVAALATCASLDGLGAQGRVLNIAGGPTWRMLGREYVARYNEVMGLSPEDGAYSQGIETFAWYETDESQRLLGYQRTSFARFVELLEAAIVEALGEW